ncbi:hypothetical protein SAMN03159338_1993 [Sphingomonas sp. NFR04]|uniref:hypothetical protein n=1 Tax=Sphingomonas sp. NFR04 TaxID=1566283 RepID=UPI0008F45A30|nr:hypothetical protein [Sphingomonas sp. NFR04]SFJ63157.1 hypothetical protein SAMN03159338_1993 [Sphingomonas sp. NFR04]
MVIGAVAALIWVGAATADPGISIFQGGRVHSPDGRWVVSARANENRIWLRGNGVRRRLMGAERYVTVRWLPAIGKVVLLERTIHFNRIAVFMLGARDPYHPDRIEKQIEADLRRHGRALQTVESRTIVFGGGDGSCALVEEAGLPPGKAEGSFLARRAAYRLDFASGSVQRIARCPGATIE